MPLGRPWGHSPIRSLCLNRVGCSPSPTRSAGGGFADPGLNRKMDTPGPSERSSFSNPTHDVDRPDRKLHVALNEAATIELRWYLERIWKDGKESGS